MANFFKNFPKTKYGNTVVTDITKRVRFADTIGKNPLVYLPYTIKEGERAEDISFYYYGNVDKVWLVYLANNIIDPKYDWPMEQRQFDDYIIENYKDKVLEISESGIDLGTYLVPTYSVPSLITNQEVLRWSQQRIVHYENDYGDIIDPKSFEFGYYELRRQMGRIVEVSNVYFNDSTYSVEDFVRTDDYDTSNDLDSAFINWKPITVYDLEFQRNEDKRHISLIDKKYANQFQSELEGVFA